MLDDLKSICDGLGVRLFLSGGTLLGAVRHHGYIPWDDDIDVMLLRSDYEKLLASFPKHPYLEIRSHRNTVDYPFAFASLCDTRTVKVERKLRKRHTSLLCLNIDIFPIDACPSDAEEQTECFRRVASFGSALKCATYRFGVGKGLLSTIRKNLGILSYRVGEIFGFVSAGRILRDWERLCTSVASPDSQSVGVLAIDHYGIREVNRLEDYSSSVTVEFEGRQCLAPVGYMNYLHNLYGADCLELPSPEKRVSHHESDCYWRDGQPTNE